MVDISRRWVVALGVVGAGSAGLGEGAARAGAGERLGLTPQTTEGPFYLPAVHLRADITEGLAGTPLDLGFTVIDQTGAPLANARVDVWHCDPAGRYSGFASRPGDPPGQAAADPPFLRGTQFTDSSGEVLFHTLYPGWYEGRTAHIHFKIWNGDRTILTCQLFLPDTLSEYLYTQVSAYRREATRDTLNRTDGIAIEAGEAAHGAVREAGGRYLARLAVTVDRNAAPVEAHRPPGGGPPLGAPLGPPPGPPPGANPPPGFEGPPPPFGGGPPHRAALSGAARVAALLPGAPMARPFDRPPRRGDS